MQILYQQNDFRIRSEATLSSFARRVAPTRLAMVHTLQFAVTHFNHRNGDHRRNLTFDARSWKEACRDLQRFTGLRKLRITLKFELGAIWHRCFTDPVWTMKFFGEILGPLEDIKLTAGAEFIVGYTWSLRICDSWRRGQFEMKHISDGMIWWD